MSADVQGIRVFVAETTSANKFYSKVLTEMGVARLLVHGEYSAVSTKAVLDPEFLSIRLNLSVIHRFPCNGLLLV